MITRKKSNRKRMVVRVDDDLCTAIASAADADQRPVSSLVRVILSDWLRRRSIARQINTEAA
jgi:hypothetical protein